MCGHRMYDRSKGGQYGAGCHLQAPCAYGLDTTIEVGLCDMVGHGFVHLGYHLSQFEGAVGQWY